MAGQANKNHELICALKEPQDLTGPGTLTITLDQQHDEVHTLGKFRLAITDSPRPLAAPQLPANIAAILAVKAETRSDAQKAELAEHFRSQDGTWLRMRDAVKSSQELQKNIRLTGAQDLAWALINSPAFLFNR
jgi:hypothetical protein